jgi:DNA-binding transcriptional MerR regulator/quercetin dioxygenase-like cupin family protein
MVSFPDDGRESIMKSGENLLFTIQQVARILDVVPGTIRNWERENLFVARRGGNNYRVFDFNDISFLKRIRDLSVDRRLNYDIIRQMLLMEIRERSARPDEDTSKKADGARKLLSKKWHQFRVEAKKTLEEVSTAVGISPSYLSKIENGHANISYEILERLAEFYDQNILFFFEEDSKPRKQIARMEGTPVDIGLPGVNIWSLIAGKDAHLKAMFYTVEPQCGNFHDHSHFGEEFLYILKGEILFTLNDTEEYRLREGDSFFFHSREKHKWINPSESKAQVIWVYSPFKENNSEDLAIR